MEKSEQRRAEWPLVDQPPVARVLPSEREERGYPTGVTQMPQQVAYLESTVCQSDRSGAGVHCVRLGR